MKRILALLLCAALCLSMCSAVAANTDYNSQPEKMARQYTDGSGVKGSIVFHAEGDAEWAQAISSISDVELQLRLMDVLNSGYHARLYVSQDGRSLAMTELWSDGGDTAWLTSEFLMGSTYAFSAEKNLLTDLTGIGRANPTWYSAAANMLLNMNDKTWEESWLPKLEPTFQALEMWLAPYASEPERLDVNGSVRMLVRYQVPAADIKQQIKALLPDLLSNQRLTKLLNSLMTEQQAEMYLHAGYLWYYEQIIDALPLEGNVVMERQFSTLGEDYSTMLTFPVADARYGLKELTIMQEADNTTLSMIFEDKTILLTAQCDRNGLVMGTVRVYDEQNGSIALGYELESSLETSVDEKEREHERYHWVLSAQPELSFLAADDPARSAYRSFDPFMVDVKADFYSKSGATTATTLELAVEVSAAGSNAGMNAVIKTASQWHLPEAYTGTAVMLDQLTDDQRAELWQDWLNNGMMAIAALRPADEVSVEDEATQTDLTEE